MYVLIVGPAIHLIVRFVTVGAPAKRIPSRALPPARSSVSLSFLSWWLLLFEVLADGYGSFNVCLAALVFSLIKIVGTSDLAI